MYVCAKRSIWQVMNSYKMMGGEGASLEEKGLGGRDGQNGSERNDK